MARNNPRKWPCADCRTPKTATRPGTRCPDCSKAHIRRRDTERTTRLRTEHDRYVAREAKLRQMRAKKRELARAARQEALAQRDTDGVQAIALYRAEKEKRKARDEATQAAELEDARRMLSLYGGDPLKAKRGRPKKGQEAA